MIDRVARAVHDAARGEALPREAIGMFLAMGMVDSPPEALAPAILASRDEAGTFSFPRFFDGGFRSIHPHWPLRMLNNVAVGQLAADLDVRGDNLVLSCEADAGVRAIGEAVEAIRIGSVRAAIAGGVSERVSAASLARSALRGTPGEAIGEGGAAVWLEDEASAAARGMAPLAFVLGTGSAFGGSEDGAGPSADAVVRAARAALDDAGCTADDVGAVVTDGTGPAEAEARRLLFGARRSAVAVVAPPVAIGHLSAGAPSVAVALAVRMLAAGKAPSMAAGRPRALEPGKAVLVLASASGGGAGAIVVTGAPR